jgi:hypothetical protein
MNLRLLWGFAATVGTVFSFMGVLLISELFAVCGLPIADRLSAVY